MSGFSVTSFSTVGFSGKVTSIAVDPSKSATVYAATIGSGTYKTSDGGQTWIASNAGLPKDILSLALDPASPGIVYAGTRIGVFKSVNGGVSWNSAGSALLTAPIRPLAIDPRHPGRFSQRRSAAASLRASTAVSVGASRARDCPQQRQFSPSLSIR